MGTLNAITSFGQIAGTVGAGMIIAGWGFGAGFWTVAAMGVVSFALGLAFRYTPPAREKAPLPVLAGYRMLLGRRSIYYGIMCAYISALPFSLSVSFYPILLIEQGFGSQAAGWLVGMRALGAIAAGVVLARFVKHADDSSCRSYRPWPSQPRWAWSPFHEPGDHRIFPFGVGPARRDDDLFPDPGEHLVIGRNPRIGDGPRRDGVEPLAHFDSSRHGRSEGPSTAFRSLSTHWAPLRSFFRSPFPRSTAGRSPTGVLSRLPKSGKLRASPSWSPP